MRTLLISLGLSLIAGAALAQAGGSPPRNLDTPHLFSPPSSLDQWKPRREALRKQILFSAGLWPLPPKTPLHPKITGKIEGEDFTVENVVLETRPGFFLAGNLYRPKGKKGPFPAIVNPHGHWSNGRLEMQEDVPIAPPAPGKMGAGRANLVSIGVNLARQGFVVLAYDAVGYNDTKQVDHRFSNNPTAWLNGVSIMGLQLWNSIRVTDYLARLPDVDRSRIGATGASGGGSQTFLLTAVDDRIKVSVPVNMVSYTMQGGCLCENGPALRVGTDNAEIAAMTAPRPLLLVAATGDWTRENPTKEWPAIRKVYELYGVPERTEVKQFNYEHNYNVESREAMYAFFGKWLKKDSNAANYRERPFKLDVAKMRAWTAEHPMPASALKEPDLTRAMVDASEKQLAEDWPHGRGELKEFSNRYEPALRNSLFVTEPRVQRAAGRGGKAALVVATPQHASRAEAVRAELVRRGYAAEVTTLPPVTMTPAQLWSEFFTTYNRAPLGDRVQSVVDAAARMASSGYRSVDVVGIGEAGPWAVFARALAPGAVGRVAASLSEYAGGGSNGKLYAPGLGRAGELRTAAMLGASSPLLLFDAGAFDAGLVEEGYRAAGTPLRVQAGSAGPREIADWLTGR